MNINHLDFPTDVTAVYFLFLLGCDNFRSWVNNTNDVHFVLHRNFTCTMRTKISYVNKKSQGFCYKVTN